MLKVNDTRNKIMITVLMTDYFYTADRYDRLPISSTKWYY